MSPSIGVSFSMQRPGSPLCSKRSQLVVAEIFKLGWLIHALIIAKHGCLSAVERPDGHLMRCFHATQDSDLHSASTDDNRSWLAI
jgi:hypothetical protein